MKTTRALGLMVIELLNWKIMLNAVINTINPYLWTLERIKLGASQTHTIIIS